MVLIACAFQVGKGAQTSAARERIHGETKEEKSRGTSKTRGKDLIIIQIPFTHTPTE